MDSSKKHFNTHPKRSANPISRLLFWWMHTLFLTGSGNDLRVEDLYDNLPEDNSESLGNELEGHWLQEVSRGKEMNRRPSLLRAILKTFGWKYMAYGVLILIHAVLFRVSQPILLGLLVGYFQPGSTTTKPEAYWYAGGVVASALVMMCTFHHTILQSQIIGMRIRVACCSLIYRKILRLSRLSLGQTAAGQVVNLLSNDVGRFDYVTMWLHYIWILPIQTAVITYLIYRLVGVSAFVGVGTLFLQTVPVQSYLSRLSSRFRQQIATRTDERVRLMSEIIAGIQVIKMYAWEKPFEKMVAFARKREIDKVTHALYLQGIYVSFMVFSERTSLYFTLVSYVLLGNFVSPDKVFAMAQFYNVLQCTMAIFYPQAVQMAAETRVSIRRLENFLLQDEMKLSLTGEVRDDEQASSDKPAVSEGDEPVMSESDMLVVSEGEKPAVSEGDMSVMLDGDKPAMSEGEEPAVSKGDEPAMSKGVEPAVAAAVTLSHVSASWTSGSITPTLNNINLEIKPGQLCAIIGPVGSGKSSLLQALLKELPVTQGRLSSAGRISYSSQEPWLFAGSVRNNILFGLPYDPKRYRDVVRACAMRTDLEQFPFGDKTVVGEKGVSLSGGQRARINLARAVYREADIYLLDDPLSAVDTHVGKHLFDDCITGFLRNKTCILVTHQLQYLRTADVIVILDNGKIENQGTYNELLAAKTHFSQMLSSEKETPTTPEAGSKRQPVLRRLSENSNKDSSFDEDEALTPEAEENMELMSKGRIQSSLYKCYFLAGGSVLMLASLVCVLIVGQVASSGADFWVTYWTTQEELRLYNRNNVSSSQERLASNISLVENATSLPTLENVILHSSTDGSVTGKDRLLNATVRIADGSETESSAHLLSTETCIYIYSLFILGSVVITTVRSLWFMKVCMNASRRLHNSMFNSILRGTMRFFDTNPSGRVLNRFSKDMGAVDEYLPKVMIDAIQIGLVTMGILVLVAVVNYWYLIPMFLVGLLFAKIRSIYLATAQDLKRLEGITRSPVFSHLSASLNGLSTIRASGAQEMVRKEFDAHQDQHTTAWNLTITGSTAFGFWLDFLSTIFVSCVTFNFLIMDDGTFGANVGLAISQSLILTGMLQYGIRQTAEVVNQMTAVERVLEYMNIDKEELDAVNKPPQDWPSDGRLKFQHLYLKYSPVEPPVLKDLNFHIQPSHKVGIVGRTGAGKSSLISALFRLTPVEGSILIDQVDTANVGLHDLRSRISIIPQEPVLFSATLRYNLDPFNTLSDQKLWEALEEVELKGAVDSLEMAVSESGSNLSAGQRQLVCLARAIVRNNRVLVLDEATANVDPQTDALIQATIRRKFADCTVLTIAHRLNTIMDSDNVLVMDGGAMVEFGPPHELLQNSDGYFHKMVEETGRAMAEQLHHTAQEAFKNRKQEQKNKENVP